MLVCLVDRAHEKPMNIFGKNAYILKPAFKEQLLCNCDM